MSNKALEVSEFSARGKLAAKGKQTSSVNLAELELAFRRFHELHGSLFSTYTVEIWGQYMSLTETLMFEAHFVAFDAQRGVWRIENICGEDSWFDFDPNDYFVFAESAV